ncbi:MAG: hypothetical protein ACLQPH_10845 [Acidimicrobiales bacterium]
MELVVDLSTAAVSLRHYEDLGRFSVQVVRQEPDDDGGNGALGALAAALSLHDAGTVAPDGDVLVPQGAVRRLAETAATDAGGSLDDAWESGLGAMVAYAGTKGWLADDGSIRAHVEWVG